MCLKLEKGESKITPFIRLNCLSLDAVKIEVTAPMDQP